jgi:uncharacterized membrane protein YedE/YeeE
MHTTLLWIIGIVLFFVSGTVTLAIIKLFDTSLFNDEPKMETLAFFVWPVLVVCALAYVLYRIVTSSKYLNPLIISDKLTNLVKPTFNTLRYKWNQRGLGIKNDWRENG